ncbi:MAG: hypothetical protein RMJ98_17400 [Myxococcales bacterium]|nr:hypothetical protein [Myxococcales bacterium]
MLAISSSAPAASVPALPTVDVPPEDEDLRRSARQLAGLSTEAPPGPRRLRLEQHAQTVNRSFDVFEESRGKAMLAWARKHLAAAEEGTVLYPFAGPDLITVRRFYPRARRYVLVALQEGGPPPDLSRLHLGALNATLDLYERVFDAFARRGFFLTMHLGAGYRTPGSARGIGGVLLAFAEREGFQVLAAEPVKIRHDGGLERHSGPQEVPETWSSLRLHLRRPQDGARVLVDYLRVDLSDGALARDSGALALLEGLALGPVVLKAASHLLQQRGFSKLRGLLLARTRQLVQDETGIAYELLEPEFNIRLFGSFQGVNGLFDGRPQRRLQEAYATRTDIEPLPFGIGYRKAGGSALMVANRKEAAPLSVP